MLTVDNLEKTYDSGDRALKGVSFEVSGNEIVAIIGPSGAGKSTLVRSINRLTEPTGGRISLDDTEVTGLEKSALRDVRRDMGMIFQEFNLVERLTVMENILSGRLGYLSTWNAFRRNFPPGQRQRVGIARAVIQRPKILLADEPTSALDPDTSREVMSLLTDIAHEDDIPIIINIHEVDLAVDYADRIIGLSDGEIVFNGPPDDLDQAARDEIYRGGESIADREEPSAGNSTDADDVIAERGD